LNGLDESVKDTNDSELDIIIKDVKMHIRKHYAGFKKQIERIGNALQAKKLIKEEDICTEIKNTLREEIKDTIISPDTIERCCHDKWKRKTKPKLREPQLRFSGDKNSQEQEVVTNVNTNVTSEGQILQQELDPDQESRKIENEKSKESKIDLSKDVRQQEDTHIVREQKSIEAQQYETEIRQQREEIKILRSEPDKLKGQKQTRGEISASSTVQGASVAELEDRTSNEVQNPDSLLKVLEESNEGHILHLECFISYEEWWDHFVSPVSRLSLLGKEMIHAKIDIDRRTQIATAITIE
jgi:hypothetical protein